MIDKKDAIATLADLEKLENTTNFVYNCNGVNDNEVLSQMSKEFFNNTELSDNASMKIVVNGVVGETKEFKYGEGINGNPKSEWELGVNNYTGNKKFIIDFGNATFEQLAYNTNLEDFYISRIRVLNNNVTIYNCTLALRVPYGGVNQYSYGFMGSGYYINCTGTGIGGTGGGFGYGFSGDGYYINCTGTGTAGTDAFGFMGSGYYINCTGTGIGGTGGGSGYGFAGSGYYINCTGTGTCDGYEASSGFIGYGYYINCVGTGISTNYNGNGSGFSGDGYYMNCTGTGIGGGSACGFRGSMKCFNCKGLGYTPTGVGAYGFYNYSTSASTYIILNGCYAPKVNKMGYNGWTGVAANEDKVKLANVTGINIGTSTNIGCYISGCVVNSEFATAKRIISPTNVADKTYTGNNIITLAITE